MTISKEVRVFTRCDLVYEVRTEGDNRVEVLKQCIPHEGQALYRIDAAYASRPSNAYYMLCKSLRGAAKRFQSTYPWLKIKAIEVIPPGERAEKILNDPLHMPI